MEYATLYKRNSENDDVLAEVRKYSSFELDMAFYSRERTRSELGRFLEEVNEDPDLTEEETSRLWNFISFLQWRLNEKENAFKSSEKAQAADKENLINLDNRILFYQENGEISKSEDLILKFKILQTQNDFMRLKTVAISELAYCFGRLGYVHQQKAIHLYEKAIEGLKPERNYLWEYGLGLNIRRQAHINPFKDQTTFNRDENNKKAATIFFQITQVSPLQNTLLKAKSWCELAWILSGNCKLSDFLPLPSGYGEFKKKDCIQKALAIAKTNHFVLERCGKEYRHMSMLKESMDCLEKALQLRDTCFTRHHLALTLRYMVNYSESSLAKGADKTYTKHCLLNQAVSHLEEAIHIKKVDCFYKDLGITFMMLEKFPEAFESFSQISIMAECRPSVFVIVNEKQGLCKLEMARVEENTNVRQRYEKQGKRLVCRAIEMASMLLSEKLHSLNLFKSLQSLLVHNISNSPLTRDLEIRKLFELVGKYKEMIDFYELLSKRNSTPGDVLEDYKCKQDFDNALLLLGLIRCTQESSSIDTEMYIETYIQGAEYALNEKDFETSNYRFKQAYRIIQSKRDTQTVDIETSPDVHIMHACRDGQCHSVITLENMLTTHLGWKFSINANDCLKPDGEVEYLRKIIENVPFIFIFLHEPNHYSQGSNDDIIRGLKLVAEKYQHKTLVFTERGIRSPMFWASAHIDIPTNERENDGTSLLEKKGLIISNILREMVKARLLREK